MLRVFGSSPKESNQSLSAQLGPRPARPSCDPTAERPPAPHACSTRLAALTVSVAGTGGVATQHGRSGRQSRSRTFAAATPTSASRWRRAAASRRMARRSLDACPRSGSTFCRWASTWPCARSWGAIQRGATRKWTIVRHLQLRAGKKSRPYFMYLWSLLSMLAAFNRGRGDGI